LGVLPNTAKIPVNGYNRKGDNTMKYRIIQSVLVAVLIVGLFGCNDISGRSGKKEAPGQVVSLSDIPTPARATIERLTAGGDIKKIEKEEQNGTVIYDVEAKVKDKDVEYDVASDGKVLTAEESVPYTSLPAAVQDAVKKYFGSAEGLKASREVEKDKTFYEVEGKKGGSTVTLKLTDTGKILEKEKG
jgi:uncharacterized membrane protein YkoI